MTYNYAHYVLAQKLLVLSEGSQPDIETDLYLDGQTELSARSIAQTTFNISPEKFRIL